MTELKEYRCYISKHLLCKAAGVGQIEIVNPLNRIMNYFGTTLKPKDEYKGPKGNDFSLHAVDFKCKNCSRLLGKGIGVDLTVEIKCRHCKETTLFSLSDMHLQRTGTLCNVQKKEYLDYRR